MPERITYGPGGFDPSKPNRNEVSRTTVDAPIEGVNADTLRQRVRTALATNAAYVALASPSNAQNAAQVKALSRQQNAIIRLLLGALDNVADTA